MKQIAFTLLVFLTVFSIIITGCRPRQSASTAFTPSQNATQPQGSAIVTPVLEAPAVPSEYKTLYNGLSAQMDGFDITLGQTWDGNRGNTILAAELLYANGNIGPSILNPEFIDLNRLLLSRFQAIGIKGVVIAIKYPLLKPDFQGSSAYLSFYKSMMAECRRLGIKVLVEEGAIFAGTPYSPVRVDWSKYTTASFLQALQDQLLLIASEIQPDYLTLANEPSTEEALTGLKITPADWSGFISSTLGKIDRTHGTLMGAGTGTWEDPAYLNSIINMPGLDYIDLHIYPFGRDNLYLDRALSYSQTAHGNGKRVTVSEAWLYKALSEELGSGLGQAEKIMDRDFYSFWEPLDARFISMMADLADAADMDFVSFFWSRHFFGYLDYQSTPHNLSTAELNRLINQATLPNVQKGDLGALGLYYQKLLQGRQAGK